MFNKIKNVKEFPTPPIWKLKLHTKFTKERENWGESGNYRGISFLSVSGISGILTGS
jgi:hypothetical protein